jgi:hypothetical protein
MGRGILIRLDGEDTWDKEVNYSFTFIKPVSPDNLIFTYSGEQKDPVALAIQLLDQLNCVYEDLFGKKNEVFNWNKIYTNAKFLNYLRDITMLQTCDIQSMNKDEKTAFFLNIKQCIWFHEYIMTKGMGPPVGVLEGWGIKKNWKRVSYKIGPYEFNYEEIVHGVFRGNKAKPGAYFNIMNSSDHRNNILNTKDQRILSWLFDEHYRSEGKAPQKLVTVNTENSNEIIENRFSSWVLQNVKYDSFCNEIILPSYVKHYLSDFNGNELELLEILMKYYKTKYMNNDKVLSDYNDGDLFISFEDNAEGI